MGAVRYAIGQVGWEHDPATDCVYVASLPQGPILRIDGAGAPILALLIEADAPLTIGEILARLGERIPELPDDADEHVERFLTQMRAHDVVQLR